MTLKKCLEKHCAEKGYTQAKCLLLSKSELAFQIPLGPGVPWAADSGLSQLNQRKCFHCLSVHELDFHSKILFPKKEARLSMFESTELYTLIDAES